MHTGDHVHLSTRGEFDTVKQIMSTIKTERTFHVPGEHDVFVDHGKRYWQVFGQGSPPAHLPGARISPRSEA
jgi:hypothetical protein